MSERTFSGEHWNAALQAWTDGKFSDEWKPYRHEAAMRGMIYPPEGTRFDSWEDDEPSERAMLIRAIRETPNLLHRAIAERRSWAGVVAYILWERDDWRVRLRETGHTFVDHDPDPREATVVLKWIIERIRES